MSLKAMRSPIHKFLPALLGLSISVIGGAQPCEVPVAPPPTSLPADTVWVEDDVPFGATLSGDWLWQTTQKASGFQSHMEPSRSGIHQHFFDIPNTSLPQRITIGSGDKLVCYVLINPCAPPQAILFSWNEVVGPGPGSWEHRAYWGPDVFGWGVPGTASRRPMGGLPAAGVWTRLEIPASAVNLEGKTVRGMAFAVHSGQVWFDRAGKITPAASANLPPSVTLTGPTDGASFTSPASITLAANASDSDGTVSRVEFFGNGLYLGQDTTSPYSITWTPLYSRSYAITAKATDNMGATTTSSPANISVTGERIGPSAVFVRTDETRQGNWKTAYGDDGYHMVNDSTNHPPYVRMMTSGASSHTWAASTTDVRALQKAVGTDRIAATWFSTTEFTIDLNLTDGRTHSVAFYCLDWDTPDERAQRMDILDGETGALLDSRSLPSFRSGKYLIWNLSGFVRVRVTRTGLHHCLLSGLFFDPAASVGPWTLTLDPRNLIGGSPSTGTVTLNAPAPAGDATIGLSSSDMGAATVPPNVVVPQGATFATFTVATYPVADRASVRISGSYDGTTQTATLTVEPPEVRALTFSPSTIAEGTSSTGTVTLTGSAPAGGAFVSLTGPSALTIPSSVTVPPAEISATFTATAGEIGSVASTVQVPASYRGIARTGSITITPGAIASMSLGPIGRLLGGFGRVVELRLTLSDPAPSSGAVVSLSSSHPGIVHVPANFTIPQGARSLAGPLLLGTSNPLESTLVRISASYQGDTDSATKQVEPLLVERLTLFPSSVVGGSSTGGDVMLNFPLGQAGPVVVALGSSDPTVARPSQESLTIYHTNSFQITTSPVSVVTPVTISATYRGVSRTETLYVTPVGLTSVTLSPSSLRGGDSSSGTVTLGAPAPAGGVEVTLSSSNAAIAVVPASVRVPAEQASATFTVTTQAVPSDTLVQITAQYGGLTRNAILAVTVTGTPTISYLHFNPGVVAGGGTSIATVALSVEAPPSGTVVTLSSSNPTVAPVPASVTVEAGGRSANFSITTSAVAASTSVVISATAGSTVAITLGVEPLVISIVHVYPSSVVGPASALGRVALNLGAPAAGAVVNLASSDTAVAAVPESVTLAAGHTQATFAITTFAVSSASAVTISAQYAGVTRTAVLTVDPLFANVLTLLPSRFAGAGTSTGWVRLNGIAPPGGAVMTLASSNSDVSAVPPSVTIPEDASSAYFSINNAAVASNVSVTISAAYGAVTMDATLTRIPPSPSTLGPNNTVVYGGGSVTGSLSLNGGAPSGGLPVTLSSSDPTVAAVPANVTVEAGAWNATFPISTSAVSRSTVVSISASRGGDTATGTFTVAPIPSGLLRFSVNPADVAAGGSTIGTVVLTVADSDAVVTLTSSDPAAATVPPTVSFSGSSVNFLVSAGSVATIRDVVISASYQGTTLTAPLTVTAAVAASSVSLSAASVRGGGSLTGNVALNGVAPAGGAVVALSSSDPSLVTAPSTVTVAAGAFRTAAPFTITTSALEAQRNVQISASYGGVAKTTTLTVTPVAALVGILDLPRVVGGVSFTATLTLNGPAPDGGIAVTLVSSNTAVATVPASVTVTGTSATFPVTAWPVDRDTAVTITASLGEITRTATLAVDRPTLASLELSTATLLVGNSFTGTVTLNGPAPFGDIGVSLRASSSSVTVTVPPSAVVTVGSRSVDFVGRAVSGTSVCNNEASVEAWTHPLRDRITRRLRVINLFPTDLTLNPARVPGGTPSTARVFFNGSPAVPVGMTITSSNPAAASVPEFLMVSSAEIQFSVSTFPVGADTPVTITVRTSGGSKQAVLTVTPASGPPLSTLALDPATVVEGESATGTVVLTAPAPSGGATVALTSSNPAAAAVPASLPVEAGSDRRTFSVATFDVSTTTSVTISASSGGATRTAVLFVAPSPRRVLGPAFSYDPDDQSHTADAIDSISPYNGQLSLTVPIGPVYSVGPGLSFQIRLRYSSRVWGPGRWALWGSPPYTPEPYMLLQGDPALGLGWMFSLGKIVEVSAGVPAGYIASDGSSHRLYNARFHGGTPDGFYYTRDGSYLRMKYLNATSGYQMWSANGNRTTFGKQVVGFDDNANVYESDFGRGRNGWHATRIENPYGSGIDITYQTDYPWVPRQITIPSIGGSGSRVLTANMSGSRIGSFVVPTFGGTTATYTLHHGTQGSLSRPVAHPSTNPTSYFLNRIDLPNAGYSSDYVFTYVGGLDPVAYARGALRSQRTPAGATITYDYGTWTFYHANVLNRPGVGECEYPPPPYSGRPVLVTGPGREPELGGLPISDCRAPDRGAGVVQRTVTLNNAITKYYQYNFPNGESGTQTGAQTQTLVVSPEDEAGRRHSTSYLYAASTGAGVTGPFVGALLRVATFSGDASVACPGAVCSTSNAKRVQRLTYDSDPVDPVPGSSGSTEGNRRPQSVVTIYNGIAPEEPVTGKYHQVEYEFDAVTGRNRKETHSGNIGGDGREVEAVWTSLMDGSRWKLDLPQTLYLRESAGEPNFSAVSNSFDAAGFPTSSTVTDGSGYGTLRTSTPRNANGFPTSESFTHGASTYTRSLSFVAGSLATSQWSTMLWKAVDNQIDSTTGLVRTARDSSGVSTEFTYDLFGRPRVTTPPFGEAGTTVTYDSPTQTTSRTALGAAEHAWSRTLTDPLGRPVKLQRKMPGGAVSKKILRYDRQGNTVFESEWVSDTVADSSAPGTSFSDFDDFGRARRIVKADGKRTLLDYSDTASYPNSVWRTVVTVEGVGGGDSETEYLSDAFGNTVRVREPGGDETIYAYNPQDRLIQVTQESQTRSLTYDAFGFLREERYPEKQNQPVSYSSYDALGQALSERHPGNLDITRSFDSAGRLTELRVDGQRYLENQYDGQVSCVVNPDGCPNGGTYKLGKLSRSIGNNPAAAPALRVIEDFFYSDRAGRLSSKETRVKDGAAHIISPMTESWAYSPVGLVSQYSHPRSSGSFAVATSYDYGLPVSVAAGGVPVVTGAAYHPSGMLASYTAANSVVTAVAQDASSALPRPSRISTSGASQDFDTGAYSYDGAGNVTGMGADSYAYDRLSRLTSATLVDLGTQAFNYDRYGNLLTKGATTYSVSTATNRLSGATYDARGNLLAIAPETYSYDGLDRMVRYQGPESADWKYLYEGSGDRLIKIPASGAASDYVWTWRDASGQIATEWTGSTICRDNVYLGSLLVGSLSTCEPSGWTYYSSDHLGTPRLITDTAGTTLDLVKYWPYGEEAGASPTTPQRLRFAGMEKDEGSRYHAHARSFDFNAVGRFLSVDLLGGSPADPQSWNRYSYVLGNPLNLVDRFGLAPDRFDLALVYDCRLTGECLSSDPVLYPFAGSSGYFQDGVFVPTGSLASEGFGQVLGSAEDASGLGGSSGGFGSGYDSSVQSLFGGDGFFGSLADASAEVRHFGRTLTHISPSDLFSARLTGQGLAAFADGYYPFSDPFAEAGLYDPGTPGLRASQTVGTLTFAAHTAVLLKKGVARGGFLNSNRYLRIGFSRLGGNRVFRLGGQLIEKVFKRKSFDLWKGGPL